MKTPPLAIVFWLSFLTVLLAPMIFPKWHLLYFAPYLSLSFYKHARYAVLWRSLGCGILIDLFSSTPFFGLSSLNYCLVSYVLWGQKRNFFEDKLLTWPLMTALFSLLSTLFSVILAFFVGQNIALSWKWCATDLLVMPVADAAFAFSFFSLPFLAIYKIRRKMFIRMK